MLPHVGPPEQCCRSTCDNSASANPDARNRHLQQSSGARIRRSTAASRRARNSPAACTSTHPRSVRIPRADLSKHSVNPTRAPLLRSILTTRPAVARVTFWCPVRRAPIPATCVVDGVNIMSATRLVMTSLSGGDATAVRQSRVIDEREEPHTGRGMCGRGGRTVDWACFFVPTPSRKRTCVFFASGKDAKRSRVPVCPYA